MGTASAAADKAALRTAIRAHRASRDGMAERFAEVLGTSPATPTVPEAVLGYAALAGEPCLDAYLDAARAAGSTVFLPVTTPGRPLTFGVLRTAMADLPRVGKWQIREPAGTLTAAEVVAGTAHTPPLDLALIPGLAFSPQGFRLGNGAGFYDRTFGPQGVLDLRQRPAARVPLILGVCYADEVTADLAAEPWDLAVDGLVTERDIRMSV